MVEFGAVGGEQDGALGVDQLESEREQMGEVILGPETAALVAAGEGGGVEDD